MKFVALTAVAALATAVSASPLLEARQDNCPEASRFGTITLSQSTLKPGDSFTLTGNFRCSAGKGIRPIYIDYFLEVPFNNNGHEPNLVLGHHDFPQVPDGQVPIDTLTTTIPTYSGYVAGAEYNIFMQVTYPIQNDDGTQTFIQGGVFEPITLDLS